MSLKTKYVMLCVPQGTQTNVVTPLRGHESAAGSHIYYYKYTGEVNFCSC